MEGNFEKGEFFSTIRTLSYRRRQGLLEIESGGEITEVLLSDGLVVEVRDSKRPLSVAIVAKLKIANKITDKLAVAYVKSPVGVKLLADNLIDGAIVTREEFTAAKRAYELDRLHRLRNFRTGKFKFTPRIVRLGHDFELNLSPGHLMLDLIEMADSDESFANTVGSTTDVRTLLSRVSKPKSRKPLTYKVFDHIGQMNNFKNVYNAALLCEKELREIVIELAESGSIEVDAPHLPGELKLRDTVDPDVGPADESKEEVEQLISDAATQLTGAEAQVPEDSLVEFVGPEGQVVKGTEEEARAVLGDQYPHQLLGDARHRAKKNEAWKAWSEAGKRKLEEEQAEATELSGIARAQNRFISLNFRLMEPKVFELMSILVLAGFFLFLALVVPGMIEHWLSVMRDFSGSIR